MTIKSIVFPIDVSRCFLQSGNCAEIYQCLCNYAALVTKTYIPSYRILLKGLEPEPQDMGVNMSY